MQPDLPVGYYLDNFLILLRFVDSTYSDILGSEEREFLDSFKSISKNDKEVILNSLQNEKNNEKLKEKMTSLVTIFL